MCNSSFKRRLNRVRTYFVLITALSLLLTACGTSESEKVKLVSEFSPRPGYLAPDFELKDYNGKSVKLSNFKGKPVLINFWATWCPPCRAEMPEIQAAFRRYAGVGLVVLGVDAREDESTVKKYVEDGSYTWIMPLDQRGEVINTYRVTAFPTSFFVDREGFIQATQIGGMDKRGLEERLAKIGLG